MADTETKAPEPGNQKVQLGIGTMIIIAIIVSTCSGKSEVQQLKGDIAEIKQQLGDINNKLDAMASKGSAGAPSSAASAAPADSTAVTPQNP